MVENKIVYVCTRFGSDGQEQHLRQLQVTKAVSREVVSIGYDVIVPHLYYPLFLNDRDESERETGLASAIRLMEACDVIFVYTGLGISNGMKAEIEVAKKKDIPVYYVKNMNELKDLLKNKSQENRATNAEAPLSETLLDLHKQMYKIGEQMLGSKNTDIYDSGVELIGASKFAKEWSEEIEKLDINQ